MSMNQAIAEATPARAALRKQKSFLHGYIPDAKLEVDPSLGFHTDADESIDPITYEVIRSKLWNLNLDHGDTIRRVSGSSIVIEGHDFNASLTTELGDGVVFGPYAIFFAGCADVVIKWTLEHRSANPGIREGDVFIQDDPWVGTNHQQDTAVFAPVFRDGKLFAWIYNCVHQRELGGSEPGSFVTDTDDCFKEASFMPPIRLVDEGVLRDDILDAWTRRSRLPDLISLEVKSQLAGLNFARQRMRQILDEYGPARVKGAMHRMTENTARTVGRRLARLPDATWRDERYLCGAKTGDFNLYRICLSLIKRGDRLCISNRGTDPSVGSFNVAPGMLRGSVLAALFPLLAYDQYLCGAGFLRQLDWEFEQGSITSASHPAAVSTSVGSMAVLNQAHYLGAKMISGDPELSSRVIAPCAIHTLSTAGLKGLDQYGQPFLDSPLDGIGGGGGAFSDRDGMDHAGPICGVIVPITDIETSERKIPMLYLYRRELPQTGAHGQWRGGATLVAAWIGHKTQAGFASNGGLLQSVTQGLSLNGALPATGGRNWYAQDTAVQEWLRDGRIPADPEQLREMAPHGGMAPPKSLDIRLMPQDVFEIIPNPGGGFGDPLLRAPELLETDLREGRLPREQAERYYGAVLDDTGNVDAEATAERRQAMRTDERLSARSRAPREPVDGTVEPGSAETGLLAGVALAKTAAGQMQACRHLRQAAGHGWRRLPPRMPRARGRHGRAFGIPPGPAGTGRPAPRAAALHLSRLRAGPRRGAVPPRRPAVRRPDPRLRRHDHQLLAAGVRAPVAAGTRVGPFQVRPGLAQGAGLDAPAVRRPDEGVVEVAVRRDDGRPRRHVDHREVAASLGAPGGRRQQDARVVVRAVRARAVGPNRVQVRPQRRAAGVPLEPVEDAVVGVGRQVQLGVLEVEALVVAGIELVDFRDVRAGQCCTAVILCMQPAARRQPAQENHYHRRTPCPHCASSS